ncbi:uncharacterized protein J4E87_005963 [Alternaria ethzedia]|uniref:uncharacterized protein n=1 Tax=Alternaria ethzedia TaxID=181014 RepID=UPI0020C57854|nr:uncharacterized protein J4E87_005963 [Alternaria ethzedia]KAI4622870.1 hypothetical protein J4E87_005963 [Alternaria ethzedia]
MTYTNVNNPITIDESVTSWYTQTISRQARSLIPDDFEKLPTFETVKFSHRKSFGPIVDTHWPQEASEMVLILGTFDAPHLNFKPLVYVYVHGSKTHYIGYFYVNPDSSICRVQQSSLQHVDIDEPFCDVGDLSVGKQTLCNRVRAMALYYFLAAGYIDEVGDYNHFWLDFKQSCAWIANKGSRPKPHARVQKQEPDTVLASAATSVPGPELTDLTHDTVASKKRTGDDEPKPTAEHPIITISAEARLANSERANAQPRAEIDTQARAVGQLRAQMTVNHQLLAKVNGLTAEISRVKNESMFSQNAYRGIQVQHDELAELHANTLNNENALRDQLGQIQARCAQAERRSKVLEKEVEGLKQRMRRAGEALNISAF